MTNEKLLTDIADLYQKHLEGFCGTDSFSIESQENFIEGMYDLMPKICDVIGHDNLIPDHCGMPKHDFCPRCGTQREEINAVHNE